MIQILLTHNVGAACAEHIQIQDGATVESVIQSRSELKDCNMSHFRFAVKRLNGASHQPVDGVNGNTRLQNGDRLTALIANFGRT